MNAEFCRGWDKAEAHDATGKSRIKLSALRSESYASGYARYWRHAAKVLKHEVGK